MRLKGVLFIIAGLLGIFLPAVPGILLIVMGILTLTGRELY